jgi:hypothetical protein
VTFWVTPNSKSSLAGACKLFSLLVLSWSGREDLNLRPPGPEFAVQCSCPCIFKNIRSSHSFSFLLDDAILWLMGDPEWVTPSSGHCYAIQSGIA